MSNWSMKVKARDLSYTVTVDDNAFERFAYTQSPTKHVIIDERVAGLYGDELRLDYAHALTVVAKEQAKSIDQVGWYAKLLLYAGIRRDHEIVAIGGGVVQDIACFLAGTLLRGVPWTFYPTTLLAQADSCIGGKSCINIGNFKNAMGTFTPPRAVCLVPHVLDSLTDIEMRSGVGEMLKVYALAGKFGEIAYDYPHLFALHDRTKLFHYIRGALAIKKHYIELDEFDRGPRRLLNYGHSFGHAIESATDFAIPHGIAVTIGMDIANFVAVELGITEPTAFAYFHEGLSANGKDFWSLPCHMRFDTFFSALVTDKKNTSNHLNLILPGRHGVIQERVCSTADVRKACKVYFRRSR